MHNHKNKIIMLLWVALAWLVLAGILALQFGASVPKSKAGWIFFVVLAPPAYVLAEFLIDRFWKSRIGRGIAASLQEMSSAVRITVSVLSISTFCVLLFLAWQALTV